MTKIPTLFLYLTPTLCVDKSASSDLDIYQFAESFHWEQDEWNGLLDTVDDVSTVLDTRRGDCDDAAVVYASWCLANDRPCTIAFCLNRWGLPRHVVVADSERVYSNSNIFETSLESYIKSSRYHYVITREMNSTNFVHNRNLIGVR